MKIKFLNLLSLLLCFTFINKEDVGWLSQVDKTPSSFIEKTSDVYPPFVEESIPAKELIKTKYVGVGCNVKVVVKPCGYGFKVYFYDATGGGPLGYSISYQIYTTDWSIVDYGFKYHEENTSWVLTPCTEYKILFYPPKCPTKPIMITAVSDGCGGIFLC